MSTQLGRCAGCGRSCDEGCYCYGCRRYICRDCQENNGYAQYVDRKVAEAKPHDVEDHWDG